MTIYLLYKSIDGVMSLSDTMCNCDGGLRTIGGCAHSTAALRYILEVQNQNCVPSVDRSEKIFLEMFGFQSDDESADED